MCHSAAEARNNVWRDRVDAPLPDHNLPWGLLRGIFWGSRVSSTPGRIQNSRCCSFHRRCGAHLLYYRCLPLSQAFPQLTFATSSYSANNRLGSKGRASGTIRVLSPQLSLQSLLQLLSVLLPLPLASGTTPHSVSSPSPMSVTASSTAVALGSPAPVEGVLAAPLTETGGNRYRRARGRRWGPCRVPPSTANQYNSATGRQRSTQSFPEAAAAIYAT
ncbi:unnamed protein product [Ectocarpus sp. 6 AP-2014]